MKCDDCKRNIEPKAVKLIFKKKENVILQVCRKCLMKWWITPREELKMEKS